MSNASHGGKGDRDRTDRTKFENNWSAIFGKKEEELKNEAAPLEIGEDEVARKLKEWNWMYDCLQNIHLYDYPVQEARELLKKIRIG